MTNARLQADDPEVLARTRQALEASNGLTPTLRVKCGSCRRVLASVGPTPPFGILFTSSWWVPRPGAVVVQDQDHPTGYRPTLRQQLDAAIRSPYTDVEGDTDTQEPHGVIALLHLPADLPQDYPDLLVRCEHHGDHILDRRRVLAELRSQKAVIRVTPVRPSTAYEIPDSSWLDGASSAETCHSSLTIQQRFATDPESVDAARRRAQIRRERIERGEIT